MKIGRPLTPLIGKRFGRLKVIALSMTVNKNIHWKCQCDCGNITLVSTSNLKNGKTTSCGCFKKQYMGDKSRTHGDCRTRFYDIWCSMKGRVLRKNNPDYKNYGARGIKVCKRWQIYEYFKEDMAFSYRQHIEQFGIKNTTIERINNDGDYEPNNCRWATKLEQRHNQRRELKVETR